MDKRLFNKAVKKAGSQAALARVLGYSRQLITNIKRGSPAGEKTIEKIREYVDGKPISEQ